jgi:hydroxymethylglutaryl-CoA reductase (NADPH)
MFVPSLMLRQLFTNGSLRNVPEGVRFSIKNRLSDAALVGLSRVAFNGRDVPPDSLHLLVEGGLRVAPSQVSPATPVDFPLRRTVDIVARVPHLPEGRHEIELGFEERFGKPAQ